jgi:hypothetical protein
MAIHQVTLTFDTEQVTLPTIEDVGPETTLAGFLRRIAHDDTWSWTHAKGDALSLHSAPHLLQRIDARHPYRVVARYLFDGVHAAAHPEVLDREHIDILHGTMAAKLLDEGLIVLEPDGIVASLRWVGTERAGVQLQRDGGRVKQRRGS